MKEVPSQIVKSTTTQNGHTVDEEQLILQCDCHGEIMVCTEDVSTFKDSPPVQEFSFGFFTHGTYIAKPNLWWRIKYAARHLWTGKIYSDYILINDKKAEELGKFLLSKIEKYRPLS